MWLRWPCTDTVPLLVRPTAAAFAVRRHSHRVRYGWQSTMGFSDPLQSNADFRRSLSFPSSATKQANVSRLDVVSFLRLDVDLEGLRERREMLFAPDEGSAQLPAAMLCRRFGQSADQPVRSPGSRRISSPGLRRCAASTLSPRAWWWK